MRKYDLITQVRNCLFFQKPVIGKRGKLVLLVYISLPKITIKHNIIVELLLIRKMDWILIQFEIAAEYNLFMQFKFLLGLGLLYFRYFFAITCFSPEG